MPRFSLACGFSTWRSSLRRLAVRASTSGWAGLVHGVAELLARSPGAGIDQLHRAQCGDQHCEDELGQNLRGLDLALLHIETLALHDPEHLLDRPARLIPGDDPQGVFEARHRMRRQENSAPVIGSTPSGGSTLFDPNRAEFLTDGGSCLT